PDTACKGLKVWEKSVDIAHVPVLARRESDGFYYLGTIKQEIESERGTFLVEFDKPLASGDKYSVCVQKTARDDILEYVNGMRHSILPGDKVLAPWEPDLVRYGPGTILLGIETRDPLRASEDEEITVCFWNDKKVKVPLGVALWIPPDTWERIVEMIHMPFTSRLKLLRAPIHSCALDDGLSKYRWPWLWPWPFICPPFHGHCHSICCSPVHVGCICCSHPKFSAWRPLLSASLLPQRNTEQQESNNKPTAQLLELESPKENEPAAAATTASSSSSSSDLESEEEMGLTKSTVVDSAVNTDSSLFKKTKLKDAAKPEWKYWKRSHTKNKKLLHFENKDKKVKEQDRKQNQTMKTKQLAQQRTNLKMQTMAEEDRQKEQQRLAHLQRVRDTYDEREFNKCIAKEIKEKQSQVNYPSI
uniref:Chromosome 11 open reading frame 16 n=1 Tax=Chelonoidis abingdonii TaxID=106734 RepID=A0A8C0GC27_CHEAB